MYNNTYIITDEVTGDVAVVDPSFRLRALLESVDSMKYKVKLILLTHRHFDHLLGAAALKELTGAKIAIHALDKDGLTDPEISRAAFQGRLSADVQTPVSADIHLTDGDLLYLGKTEIEVLHTPGHTEGSVCFMIGNALFSGDTLFAGDIGRTDLPTGDMDDMRRSLRNIAARPGIGAVYPGHGEATTLAAELANNPYLNGEC
jgi:glyoxylase-like metal-dependent hydrolase (beta-lactamase superfamily II)